MSRLQCFKNGSLHTSRSGSASYCRFSMLPLKSYSSAPVLCLPSNMDFLFVFYIFFPILKLYSAIRNIGGCII